jgi:hypothetical protein
MDTKAHASEDPLGDYRNFPDSWAKKDGKFVRCWDGVSMNPSPSLSYGPENMDYAGPLFVALNALPRP